MEWAPGRPDRNIRGSPPPAVPLPGRAECRSHIGHAESACVLPPGRLRFALAHHGTDRRLSRFTARLQSAKDRAPIRVRPILAQLELAFEPLDLDLESRNSSKIGRASS